MQALIYLKPTQPQDTTFDPAKENEYYATAGQLPWCVRVLCNMPAYVKSIGQAIRRQQFRSHKPQRSAHR